MSLEEIEEEYLIWRKLEDAGGLRGMWDAFSSSSSSGGKRAGEGGGEGEGDEGEDQGAEGMSSFPPNWVRNKYSHPGWIPLITDHCGNYIGLDLDPPPPSPSPSSSPTPTTTYGQPGQIIVFGREIDEKTVLFPSDGNEGWGRFLSDFVEELKRGSVARLVDGEGVGVGEGSGSEESGEDEDGLGDRDYLGGGRYGEEGEGGGMEGGGGGVWLVPALPSSFLSMDCGN